MQRAGKGKLITGFLVSFLLGAALLYAAPRIPIPSGYTVGRIMYVSATNTMGESTLTTNTSGNLVVPGTLAVTGAQTFTGATAVNGDMTIASAKTLTLGSGGVVPIAPKLHLYAGDAVPATATTGTDTTPASGTQYTSELFIPHNMTLTGVSWLIGSVGGTDRVIVVLYDSAGAVLANSTVTSNGTVAGTTATMQRIAFTSTYAAKGPNKYYVAVRLNGNTARIRTQAFGDHDCGTQAVTHATVAAITPPSTFTTAQCPIAMTY